MAEKEKRKYLVIKMADVDQVAEGRGLLFDPFTQMTVEQLLEAIRSEREVDGRPTDNKYIICNGDEGDPGAFMDRMLLESYPYRIIEGMLIAAFAVGASQGYFYIRAEYPLAVSRIRQALQVCKDLGYLGSDIMQSGHSIDQGHLPQLRS